MRRRDPSRIRGRTRHEEVLVLVLIIVLGMMMIPYCHGRSVMRTFTRNIPRMTEHHHHSDWRRTSSTISIIPAWITCSTSSSSSVRRRRRSRPSFHPVLPNHERIFPTAAAATAATATATATQTRQWTATQQLSATRLSISSRPFSSSITKSNETSMQKADVTCLEDNKMLIQLKHNNIDIDFDWRKLPSLNPTIYFKSWIVPTGNNACSLQRILNAKEMQPYLATRHELLQHLQQRGRGNSRFRVVVDITNSNYVPPVNNATTHHDNNDATTTQHKLVLLHPDTPTSIRDLDTAAQTLLNEECNSSIRPGPIVPISFCYHDFTAHYALTQILPPFLHPVPSAFETIGHVVHLNLKPLHLPYKHIIGQVLLELIRPKVNVVMAKRGEVYGPFRTYDFEILAATATTAPRNEAEASEEDDNDNDEEGTISRTMVSVTEWGITCRFNVRNVYWSSRLSTERKRLCMEELFVNHNHNNNNQHEHQRNELFIADAFCGVGALCLQAIKHYKSNNNNNNNSRIVVWANDWNPAATASLEENAKRNGIAAIMQDTATTTTAATTSSSLLSNDHHLVIRRGDAYEFLMDLGIQATTARRDEEQAENTAVSVVTNSPPHTTTPRRLPDHVVMNYPLEAPTFLGALRWWPVAATSSSPLKKKKQGRRVVKNVKNINIMDDDDSKAAAAAAAATSHYDVADSDDDSVIPRVHVYTFARADPDTNRSAKQVAVDLIAQNLIPGLRVVPPPRQEQQQQQVNHVEHARHSDVSATTYDDVDPANYDNNRIQFKTTQDELNEEYNANVRIHAVRDVAPGKVVYCVSFSVTPRLLRHMQGDFDD